MITRGPLLSYIIGSTRMSGICAFELWEGMNYHRKGGIGDKEWAHPWVVCELS